MKNLYDKKKVAKYNITNSPLYFVRSGIINVGNGRVRFFGDYGYLWLGNTGQFSSSTSASAYTFAFNANYVYPVEGAFNRWAGRPIR